MVSELTESMVATIQSVREPNSHAMMTLIVDLIESFSWRGVFVSAGFRQDELVSEPTSVAEPSPADRNVPAPKLMRLRGRIREIASVVEEPAAAVRDEFRQTQ